MVRKPQIAPPRPQRPHLDVAVGAHFKRHDAMEADYFYKVQVQNSSGDWIAVEDSEYNESFRAIHRAQSIMEKTKQKTRVVKPNGAVVWSMDMDEWNQK